MLEAMELVRADEVHLASKSSLVALPTKVMCVGGNLWSKNGGVIVTANLGGKLPGAHGEPRRCTQRGVAVGTGKVDARLCQFIEMRRLDDRVWIVHL